MLKILQVIGAIGASVGMRLALGPINYWSIATLVVVGVGIWIWYKTLAEFAPKLVCFMAAAIVGLTLGALWPGLPIVFAWGRASRQQANQQEP